MGQTKYTVEQREFAKNLIISCEVFRDSLPYHKAFDVLYQQYQKSGLPKVEEHDFWLLLLSAGKEGGCKQSNASKLPVVIVSQEERYELMRLCPDNNIGSRDRLPYTDEFDSIYEKFINHADRNLTKNEFWRALSKVAKASRKPSVSEINPTNEISKKLLQELHLINPWWQGDTPMDLSQKKRRSAFDLMYEKLTNPTSEHKPFRALYGPRQVGKSTIMEQLIQTIIYKKRLTLPANVLRVQFDNPETQKLENPIIAITRWFEKNVAKDTFNNLWKKKKPVFLFFDELQEVQSWSEQLKIIIDQQMCKCLVTGSSALRILAGRESLPGRLAFHQLSPLSLSEIAIFQGNTIQPFRTKYVYSDLVHKEFWIELSNYRHLFLDETFESFSEFGGYPICHTNTISDAAERNDFLKNNVIGKTIAHDLKASIGIGVAIAKGQQNVTFVRKIFGILCQYTGRDISYSNLCREIENSTGTSLKYEQLHRILDFFNNSMLFKMIYPSLHHLSGAKNRVKPCLCDHAIRAAWLAEETPLYGNSVNADVTGHVAEGIVGYLLASIAGTEISYQPPNNGDEEIDFIIEIGDKHIPVEVKYRNNSVLSGGMKKYLDKPHHNAPFGIVITKNDAWVKDRLVAIPLKQFLLLQ